MTTSGEISPASYSFQKVNSGGVANKSNKKKFRKFLHAFKSMYRSDTIRPRRTHQWTNAIDNQIVKNKTPIFRIGEYQNPDYSSINVTQSYGEGKYQKKEVKKSTGKKCMKQIENYCENTTLHGLRYVGDTSLTVGERIFWLIAFSIAIGFAGYFISNIYKKWNSSPVIISFSPFDADLTKIPFPAITICNMNQAKSFEAEKILREGPESEKNILSGLCDYENETVRQIEAHEDTSWETLRDFLVKVGSSCENMLRLCKWRNEIINCESAFNNDLTDEGLCCSFNRLPDDKIYRNAKEIGVLNRTYPDKVYDWSPERGFTEGETGDDYIPRRPLGAGSHLGLSVVLDAQVNDYFCSSTSSIGFKIILSNPIETPKMADFGFLLGPGTETRYAVVPSIREATESLKNIEIEKRQCYFSSERRLRYYRFYTSRNCGLECLSNYTYQMCKCIPYFLPTNRYTNVDAGCIYNRYTDCRRLHDIVNLVKDEHHLHYNIPLRHSCNCLPGCAELIYTKSHTNAQLNVNHKYLKLVNTTKKYFETYTQRNCNLECLSNYTLSNCACVPYYLPRSRSIRICGNDRNSCINKSKKNMEQTNGNASSCHCLPGCYEVNFGDSKSSSLLSKKVNIQQKSFIEAGNNFSNEYILENMAIAHFFFTSTKFTKQVKSELYGSTEILSNIGGLLGLCLGFSFLSFVELVYFLTLRVCCKFFKSRRKNKNQVKEQSEKIKATSNKYPFLK